MASAAAQKYFNSFPPAEQERIRASWGGGDLMDEWFNNAVGAGSVQPDGTVRDPNTGQGMSEKDALAANEAANANISGASGLKKGQTPTPLQLRQYAREAGWSEDFNRFNDATLASWIKNNWDTNAMKFTTEGTDENGNKIPGYVEKPVDAPEGWKQWGPSGKMIPTEEANARMAKWGGGGGPPPEVKPPAEPTAADYTAKAGMMPYTGNPMTDMLLYQFNSQSMLNNQGSNIFGMQNGRDPNAQGAGSADVTGRLLKGGGLWWGNTADVEGANMYEGAGPQAPPPPPSIAPPPPVAQTQAKSGGGGGQQAATQAGQGPYSDPYENQKAGYTGAPDAVAEAVAPATAATDSAGGGKGWQETTSPMSEMMKKRYAGQYMY